MPREVKGGGEQQHSSCAAGVDHDDQRQKNVSEQVTIPSDSLVTPPTRGGGGPGRTGTSESNMTGQAGEQVRQAVDLQRNDEYTHT